MACPPNQRMETEDDDCDDFLDFGFPEILPEFHCFETGKPFSHCTECGLSVLENKTEPYMITRAIQDGEPLVEWALCGPCSHRIREGISEASKKAIQRFLAGLGLGTDYFTRSVEEKIASCFVCHRQRSDFTGYTITAVCSGQEHINFDTPRLICHDCEAEAGELLSDETRDFWDDFIEQHCGPPPGLEQSIPKARPVLL